MVVGTLLGAGMVATSVIGAYLNQDSFQFRRRLLVAFNDAKVIHKKPNGEESVTIQAITKHPYGYKVDILLPNGMPISKFKQSLEAIGQSMASEIRFKHIYGRKCQLSFGMCPMYEKMNYSDKLPAEGLSIPLYSPFGIEQIDFWDEASCHLLNAGATRMGKSVFLRLLITHLMRITQGKINIVLINNKMEDTFIFEGYEQIKIATEADEAGAMLLEVMKEIKRRKDLLRQFRDSVNVHEFRKKHPGFQIPPLFVIVDEYGRFADDDFIQDMVTSLAETAGYLDVHLVIASQRPDVQTVLKPRIRANILTRICFTTADAANSTLVLGIEDAAHLGGIKGRAVLLNGLPVKVQVPYISEKQAYAILKRSGKDESARQEDTGVSETLPHYEQESTRTPDMSRGSEPDENDKHDNETTQPRRTRKGHTSADWTPEPLLFESADDKPPFDTDSPSSGDGRGVSWFKLPKNLFNRTDDREL